MAVLYRVCNLQVGDKSIKDWGQWMKKQIGWGTGSFILMILGMVWLAYFSKSYITYYILNIIRVKPDLEVVALISSLIFFIPALVIADKYNEDAGAIFARWIALIANGVIIVGTILRFI